MFHDMLKILAKRRRAPLLLSAVVLAVHATSAAAQAWPQKPIHIIVPVAPGGIADTFSRIIGIKLTELWGQPVIVENKPGGGGNIGADYVAKSAPDGYTLVMGYVGSHAVNPSLFKQMPYDPARDFVPVALVMEAEGLLAVNPLVPVHNVPQLIALARAQQGKLAYSSGGIGTSSHLAGELFKSMAKVDMVHVPYKGNVPSITDLIGGQVSLSFATMPTVLPHVKAGKLRGIAVIGAQRSPAVPELPTVAETVPGFDVNNWIGLFAPAGTPPEIVQKLNVEVNRVMLTPEVQKRLESEGARLAKKTPEEFGQFVRAETVKWAKVLKDAGINPE
ncbi:MAG: tripartite tricarboxylate transporter substrate binding protein [Betaproteobacteria bacterium]